MFKVIVDSAANLPAVVAKKYDIQVLSFVNCINGEPVVCYNPDFTPEEERAQGKEYYDSMRAGLDVKTGLVSIGEFEEAFEATIKEGFDIIYLSLSSGISGTFNAARIAAENVLENNETGRRIRLIDTMNASLAQGILAIYSAELRDKGMDVDEAADIIDSKVLKMNGVFTVGDLKYISNTGRITRTTALVGNVLSIKPILRGDSEGHIVQFSKCRGRKASVNTLINLVCDNITDSEEQIIGIAHADAYEESLYIMEEIQKRVKVREFINTSYDLCTGTHVGPDTLALFFMGKDRELSGK